MKSLTNYIFELKSSTYQSAADRAKKLGQSERSKMFQIAADRAKEFEKNSEHNDIINKIENLTFDFQNETEGYYNPYKVNGVTFDDDNNVFIQLCGFENTTEKWDDFVEKWIEEYADEEGEELTDDNHEEYIDKFYEYNDGDDIDYFMWLIYDRKNDMLYLGPDYSTSGPHGKTYEPKITDIDDGDGIRVKDRKTVNNLAKLVKILNPETELTKNDFIK